MVPSSLGRQAGGTQRTAITRSPGQSSLTWPVHHNKPPLRVPRRPPENVLLKQSQVSYLPLPPACRPRPLLHPSHCAGKRSLPRAVGACPWGALLARARTGQAQSPFHSPSPSPLPKRLARTAASPAAGPVAPSSECGGPRPEDWAGSGGHLGGSPHPVSGMRSWGSGTPSWDQGT